MPDEQYEVLLVIKGSNQAGTVMSGLEQRIQNIDRNTQNLHRTNTNAVTGFNNLSNAAFGFMGAIAGNQILSMIGDLNQMGAEANNLENTWNLLTDEIGDGQEILARLREETRGATSDLELMSGASTLMRLGIADNEDELVELTTLISRLKEPTVSTGDAINNFSLMLANQSVMRLDSFGLSASRATARINELMEAGSTRSEAFNVAVIEQMREQNDRLGTAIDANIRATDRFAAAWQNAMSSIGQVVNDTLNEAANTTLMIADIVSAVGERLQGDAAAAAALDQQIRIRGQIIGINLLSGIAQGFDPAELQRIIGNTLRELSTNPALMENLQVADVFRLAELPFDPNMVNTEVANQLIAIVTATDQLNTNMTESTRIIEEERTHAEALNTAMTARLQGEIATADALRDQLSIQQQTQPILDDMSSAMHDLIMLTAGEARGTAGGITLFSPEEAQRAGELAEVYENTLAHAQELHDQGLLGDDQLAQLQEGANQVERMATEAERGAAAFETMTLQQAMAGGTEQNQLLAGLSDELLSALEDESLSDENRQAIEDALDRASGRATDVTFTLRDSVVPALEEIALGGDEDALVAALQGVEGVLREGRLTGRSDEEIAGVLGTAAEKGSFEGLEGIFESLDIKGNVVDPLSDAQEVIDTGIAPGIDTARIGMESIAESIRQVSSIEHKVRIALDVSAPAWLTALLGVMGQGGSGLAQIVRDNGGVVPGSDHRTQTAGHSNPT